MKREAIVSFISVALFLTSVFPLSTFSGIADSHGSPELGSQSTADPTDWWPMLQHDPAHTGYTDMEVLPPLVLKWIISAGERLLYLVVAEGSAYVFSDSKLYAINTSDWSLEWTYGSIGGWSPPAVVNGIVYVGDWTDNFVALDARNGSVIWEFSTGGANMGAPVVTENVVYFSSDDGYAYAVTADKGILLWKYATGVTRNSPTVANGIVYLTGWNSTTTALYAINATNGNPMWNYASTPGSTLTSASVSDGIVYLQDPSNVLAIDASTGKVIWVSQIPGIGVTPAIGKGNVYVSSSFGNKIYALDASSGALKWTFQTQSNSYVSGIAVSGDIIYFGEHFYYSPNPAKLYAFNATDGSALWTFDSAGASIYGLAIAENTVYFSTDAGVLYAFSKQVNVYRDNPKRTEPAPMGIADYGIRPSGPYEYNTTSFVGVVTIAKLSTYSSLNETSTTFQLNVNLAFNTSFGQYVYWMQDVAYINTSSLRITFEDNIWNSSAYRANMTDSGVSGNGQVELVNLGSFNQSFYYDWANRSLPYNDILTYPTTITFHVTSGVDSYGKPNVSFAYDDGHGLITYDTVTFDVTNTSSVGFEVDGSTYKPYGGFYDSELVIGGGGDGSSTIDVQSDVQLQLEYWNGHNYQIVPNAYNFGSDTAERIDNVTLFGFSPYLGNGEIFAEMLNGTGQQLGELYDQSQIGIIDISSPLTSGTLYVTNASNPNAGWQITFVRGEVTLTLYPGSYFLHLYNQTGQRFDQGNFTISAGQTLYLQTPFGARVTLGDINHDGTVDIYDAILLAGAYNSRPGDRNWNPNADINGDGIVDIYDAILLANSFNQHYP